MYAQHRTLPVHTVLHTNSSATFNICYSLQNLLKNATNSKRPSAMRFFCAAMLAIFLMGIIEALAPIDSTNSESSSRAVPRFVVGAASRRLRFQDAATMEKDGSDDEERTGSIPKLISSSIGKLMSKTFRAQKLDIETLARHWEDPESVFTILKLDRAIDNSNLDDVFDWLKYVGAFNSNPATKRSMSDTSIYNLVGRIPEKDLVVLFQKLRDVPVSKNLADRLQMQLFLSSPSSHKPMIDAWMKARVPPHEVFTILKLDEQLGGQLPQLYQLLRYINAYRTTRSFTDEQTLGLLVGTINEAELARMFQSVKEAPDLKAQATNVQHLIFKKLIVEDKEPPHEFAYYLTSPFGHPTNVFYMEKNDPTLATFMLYTLEFAKARGGKSLLESVEKLFAADKVKEAFELLQARFPRRGS